MSTPWKRKVLTLDLKAKIIADVISRKKTVAERYNTPQSTLSSSDRKKVKTATYVDMEKVLFSWFMDMRVKNMPLCRSMLKQRALNFACMLSCHDFKESKVLFLDLLPDCALAVHISVVVSADLCIDILFRKTCIESFPNHSCKTSGNQMKCSTWRVLHCFRSKFSVILFALAFNNVQKH